MPQNPNGSWTPLEYSDLCGPDEFADHLLDYRDWRISQGHKNSLALISEQGLRQLIKLVYYASQDTEEGEFTRLRCYISYPVSHTRRAIVRFAEPVRLTSPRSLKKIAPIVRFPNRALRILEQNDELYCDAIVYVDNPADMPATLGRPELHTNIIGGLHIQVDGPGSIRASESGETIALSAGELKSLYAFSSSPIVRAWLSQIAEQQHGIITKRRPELADYFGGQLGINGLNVKLWDSIIRRVIEKGHGGAIAILPPGRLDHIEIKYQCSDVNLSTLIQEFWEASIDATQDPDNRNALSIWYSAKHRLQVSVEALSDLANVDGCVVLERNLELIGFGGEIKGTDSIRRDSFRVEKVNVAGHSIRDVDIENFGMRHRSACYLCHQEPDALAFVISQDGDLRIFSGSHDEVVRMNEDLVPAGIAFMQR